MTGCAFLDNRIRLRKNGKSLPCESLYADNVKLCEIVQEMEDRMRDMEAEFYGIAKKLRDDIACSPGGSTGFMVDNKRYETDSGYAMDGVDMFVELLGKRLGIEAD